MSGLQSLRILRLVLFAVVVAVDAGSNIPRALLSIDPQDRSVGRLIWPLSESNRINGGDGTYFLPNEVSCSGSIVSVHTCFFYNDEGNKNNNNFRLVVSVFRRGDNQYTRQNSTIIRVTRYNSNATQNCTSMNLPRPLPVLKGDKFAVHILDGCSNNVCPLQPNLNISAETPVFFTPSFIVRTIPVSQVMATESYTNVYLDVSTSIVTTSQHSTGIYVTQRPTLVPSQVAAIAGGVVAAIVVILLCIGVTIIPVVCLKRRKQHANLTSNSNIGSLMENFLSEMTTPTMKNLPSEAQECETNHDSPTDVPKLIISSSCIRLLDVVGQGEFGLVYKAHLVKFMQKTPEIVAVKTLKGFFDQKTATDIMKESEKMQGFQHPHVLNIIGVCVDAGPAPYIVMPFMANGSLLAYIKKEKINLVVPSDAGNDELANVACKRLADMCIQIAKGMEYLAEKRIVHRDLATRNCLIDDHFVIKVADFGLSENMYLQAYFRQDKDQAVRLPVKWLALEALTEGVFSEKSDVWSYGVTCWELFTGGRIPYPGVDPVSLSSLLEDGHRLDKPNNAACSEDIYLFMFKCWHVDPKERPTFSELVSLMSQTLENLAGYAHLSAFSKLEAHSENPYPEIEV